MKPNVTYCAACKLLLKQCECGCLTWRDDVGGFLCDEALPPRAGHQPMDPLAMLASSLHPPLHTSPPQDPGIVTTETPNVKG